MSPWGESSLTVKELFGSLSVGQAWTLVATTVTVLSASYGLGARFGTGTVPSSTGRGERHADVAGFNTQTLVPCSKADGYPKGQWMVTGHLTAGEPTTFADHVWFDSSTTG